MNNNRIYIQSLSLRIIEKDSKLAQIIFMKVALSSFQEVINRLCRGTQGESQGQEVIQGINKVKLF